VDPTNPVTSQYFRSVAEVDAHGNIQITDGNAYSGNNGTGIWDRLSNGTYVTDYYTTTPAFNRTSPGLSGC